ncbi:SPFH domain-containing protein [Ruminococcus albus]|uniref:Membrane protease subunit, stomatin/prohibitin family, contains C-terminal Zn-ribbon domain n=1 Tax=Ruminococcus albus TaxID=1264 RepID=A0A1I1K0A1_RUMAL|nr:SPFH domain-containing protein [Ruminococcus albus]SFC51413.1 Membrane protease subunit, stomatin/prohibitin family, contains C-terminal Zn-ribbon domain [Ruminococcus albus]
MGLFRKNPNEVAYTGGEKHWADVIKNSGPGELLIWRQPEEDFNTNSTLIVMPGEEAIFIKGGTVEQTFDNGTYKLSTENYPFISRLRNAFTGGVSTFNCVVYFVRKAHSVEIRWGTDSPIQVRDKMLGIATKLRARGAYKVQIGDPVKFLEKLIGNNVFYQTQEELNKYFISEFQSKVKSVIARAINESNTEILGIDSRLDELSDTIEPFMQEILDDYGLKCVKFTVAAIDIDDDELRRRYDEIGVEKLRNAQADKAVMGILGDDWGKQQAANILGNLSMNPGAGGVAATGAGMGMGMAAGGVFGNMAQQMFAPMSNSTPVQQPQPFQQAPSGRFAQPTQGNNSPTSSNTSQEDPMEVLGKLKRMLDAGLIEQSEYDAKKAEILSRM